MEEGLVLNLAGADTSATDFDALPPATYDATVYEVTLKETENEGKLPAGTPYFNVQFRIEGEKYENRRVFRKFFVTPKEINGEPYKAYDKMNGMLVNFFKAIGYDEAEVMGGSFSPDFEDMCGRECRITVTRRERKIDGVGTGIFDNDVSSVKPAGTPATTATLL